MMKRTSFFGVSSRRSCRSSQNHFFNFIFDISGWGIDLDYCDVEMLALEMNENYSVVFEIAPKYCILDSFVNHEATLFLLRDSCPQ